MKFFQGLILIRIKNFFFKSFIGFKAVIIENSLQMFVKSCVTLKKTCIKLSLQSLWSLIFNFYHNFSYELLYFSLGHSFILPSGNISAILSFSVFFSLMYMKSAEGLISLLLWSQTTS